MYNRLKRLIIINFGIKIHCGFYLVLKLVKIWFRVQLGLEVSWDDSGRK